MMLLSARAIVPVYLYHLILSNVVNHTKTTMSDQVKQAPELSPPFVNVAGIANLRDIGGYTSSTNSHQTTRHNLVYRSADPSKVTPDGLAKLKELGVKKVFDLRSIPEQTNEDQAKAGDASNRPLNSAQTRLPTYTHSASATLIIHPYAIVRECWNLFASEYRTPKMLR